ncbi:MAG: 50S ribosomal protein L11 methyltransferase [Anaerolineae bacterium]
MSTKASRPTSWTRMSFHPPNSWRSKPVAGGRPRRGDKRLESALGYMNMMYPMPTPEYRIVEETDWAEAWKVHYHPLRIGRRLLIRPLWTEVELQPGDVEIALDPGMAFGTGTHPTTQLCLEAVEDLIVPGAKALDLGCGSGILAIAAAKLGAAHVLALDIDPVAVESARQNAEQNGAADKITVQEGSLESVITSARRFDLLLCNILARIIIQMCGQRLGDVVRPGGLAIFSGIIEEQAADVEAALRYRAGAVCPPPAGGLGRDRSPPPAYELIVVSQASGSVTLHRYRL